MLENRELKKWLGWHKKKNGVAGIEVSAAGIAFAYIEKDERGKPFLKHCDFYSSDTDLTGQLALLKARIRNLGLTKADCNLVLSPERYQLLLVESPKVPSEELRDAVRWRIKDLIDFPLNDAIVDLFSLPKDSTRNGASMAYAVAAQKDSLKSMISLVENTGLRLSHIDIGEMALRNIVDQQGDYEGVAIVKIGQRQGNLVIIREGNVYLSRRFDLPYNGGLFDELPEENLILELQRSLDYYERQMGQTPPAMIYLCGENIVADKITDNIRSNLSVPVDILTLSELQLNRADRQQQMTASPSTETASIPASQNSDSKNTAPETRDPAILQMCLHAIGGALRREEVLS